MTQVPLKDLLRRRNNKNAVKAEGRRACRAFSLSRFGLGLPLARFPCEARRWPGDRILPTGNSAVAEDHPPVSGLLARCCHLSHLPNTLDDGIEQDGSEWRWLAAHTDATAHLLLPRSVGIRFGDKRYHSFKPRNVDNERNTSQCCQKERVDGVKPTVSKVGRGVATRFTHPLRNYTYSALNSALICTRTYNQSHFRNRLKLMNSLLRSNSQGHRML
jgi:hypothetical protein